jgi:hypothetical protein
MSPLRFLEIFVAICLVAAGCSDKEGSPIVLTIANIDGPPVAIEAWAGAKPRPLPCGGSIVFDSQEYPMGPWHVTITNSMTGDKLFDQGVDGPRVYMMVRTGGVVVGDQALGGPAGVCLSP